MPYLLWHWGFLEVFEKVLETVRHWKSIAVPSSGGSIEVKTVLILLRTIS